MGCRASCESTLCSWLGVLRRTSSNPASGLSHVGSPGLWSTQVLFGHQSFPSLPTVGDPG